MKKKKSLRYALSCLALSFLLIPQLSSAADMEILSRVDISTERCHAWNPWFPYNSDKDEFFVIWNSTGKSSLNYHIHLMVSIYPQKL